MLIPAHRQAPDDHIENLPSIVPRQPVWSYDQKRPTWRGIAAGAAISTVSAVRKQTVSAAQADVAPTCCAGLKLSSEKRVVMPSIPMTGNHPAGQGRQHDQRDESRAPSRGPSPSIGDAVRTPALRTGYPQCP